MSFKKRLNNDLRARSNSQPDLRTCSTDPNKGIQNSSEFRNGRSRREDAGIGNVKGVSKEQDSSGKDEVKTQLRVKGNRETKKPRRYIGSATLSCASLSSSLSMASVRSVPAFTPASRMKNSVVIGPPKLGIFQPRPSPPTTFRKMYERGDIPVTLLHDHRGHSLRWKADIDKVDYHHFLPLFFDGLRETKHPYDFFSRAGVTDLLSRGGDRILPVVPQLILPLKSALSTREPRVVCTVLHVIQELVTSSPHIGEALVPYYRQLLPTLNLFKHWNVNLGDEIDYSQRRKENLGDLIQETLELLERRGGRDAYINIKYMVPTYQSCVMT